MARIFTLFVALMFLLACGNAVVSTAAPGGGDSDPTALLPGDGAPDAGGPLAPVPVVDAGPTPGSLSGTVVVASGTGTAPAIGVAISLAPSSLSTTTDENGSYLFAAVPPGPFQLTASLAGYPPATASGVLQSNQDMEEPNLELQVSQPLLVPDGGFAPTWLSFSPGDGGQLYVADTGSFWRVGLDGGATPLTSGAPNVVPLGFATDGTPVYLAAEANGIASNQGLLQLSGTTLAIDFSAPGPYLIGDAVYFANASTPPYQTWSVVSAASPAPAVVVAQAYASPAPQPTSFGLVGYAPTSGFEGGCAQAFSTGTAVVAQGFICPGDWSLPTAIGVSPDGTLAALELSTSNDFAGNESDSWQVELLSTAGGPTELSQHASATDFADLTAIVPLSATSAAEIFSDGTMILDTTASATPAPIPGTGAAALPDGSVLYLSGGGLYDGPGGKPLFFDGSWAQPLISPDGVHVVFLGVPAVIDIKAWTSTPLAETPQTAQFSVDGSALLAVGQDNSIHVITFPAAGLADAALEGSAALATFTPDGKSVVYGGTDPLGRTGVFAEPAKPPAAQAPVPATDGGTP